MSYTLVGESAAGEIILTCCKRCRGLFLSRDIYNKHVAGCSGNPYKSPSQLFACERKFFFQFLQEQTPAVEKETDCNDIKLADSIGFQEDCDDISLASALPSDSLQADPGLACLQEDVGSSLLTNIEEYPQLQYLDLAQKDSAQHLSSNTKDPFLINAAVRPPPAPQRPPVRGIYDLQTSPTFQDTNCFFPNQEESTQLDYLDLARLDLYFNKQPSQPLKPLDRQSIEKAEQINADQLERLSIRSTEASYCAGAVSSFPASCGNDPAYTGESERELDDLVDDQDNCDDVTQSSSLLFGKIDIDPIRNFTFGTFDIKPDSDCFALLDDRYKCSLKKTVDTSNFFRDDSVLNTKTHSRRVERKSKRRKSDSCDPIYFGFLQKEGTETQPQMVENVSTFETDRKKAKKSKAETPKIDKPVVHVVVQDHGYYTTETTGEKTVYFCKKCNYKVNQLTKLDKHVAKHEEEPKVIKCSDCGHTCTDEGSMLAHQLHQHSTILLCGECGQRFSSQKALEVHEEKHKGIYTCDQCSYSTNFKNGFDDHMKKHAGSFLYCNYEGCNFKSIYKRVLVQHKKKHEGIKNFVCDQCGYSTAEVGCLKKHQMVAHENERAFQCPQCTYSAVTKHEVVQHVRAKHLKQKLFYCNQCNYKTGYNSGMRLHLMAHEGVKPYKCSACDYKSNAMTKVSRHIKTKHSGNDGITVEKLDVDFQMDLGMYRCTEDVIEPSEINVIEIERKNMKNNNSKTDNGSGQRLIEIAPLGAVQKNVGTSTIVDSNKNRLISLLSNTRITNTNGNHSDMVMKTETMITSSEEIDDEGEINVVDILHSPKIVKLPEITDPNDLSGDTFDSLAETFQIPGFIDEVGEDISAFQCKKCSFIVMSKAEMQTHLKDCFSLS